MSALEAMTAELTARLIGRLRPLGVGAAQVAMAVQEALAGTDWAALNAGFVAADAAAQAFRQAYEGHPPTDLADYQAEWSGARAGQSAINREGMVDV
jgi:nitrous oxide reductase